MWHRQVRPLSRHVLVLGGAPDFTGRTERTPGFIHLLGHMTPASRTRIQVSCQFPIDQAPAHIWQKPDFGQILQGGSCSAFPSLREERCPTVIRVSPKAALPAGLDDLSLPAASLCPPWTSYWLLEKAQDRQHLLGPQVQDVFS